jgi:hypothetical protein
MYRKGAGRGEEIQVPRRVIGDLFNVTVAEKGASRI